MRKVILVVLCLIGAAAASLRGHGERANRQELANSIPQQINDLPFYGAPEIQKTQEMIRLDAQFKADAVANSGTPQRASQYYSDRAWQFFWQEQLNSSMRRANQAWLLDQENYSAYWVMALVQRFRNAPPAEVESLFRMAIARAGASDTEQARLMQDYETFQKDKGLTAADGKLPTSAQYQAALGAVRAKMLPGK